jgi:YcaO-like protein with predicted kinase domain
MPETIRNSLVGDSYWETTNRTHSPEQTWKWIQPKLDKFGITRVADLTGLDEIGIPVYQAIRPDSWTLRVSQGKGLSDAAAKVSAVMESIDLWHAERVGEGELRAEVGEMRGIVGYEIADLPVAPMSTLHDRSSLEWTEARRLSDNSSTWLPTELLRLDGRYSTRWTTPRFIATSNGLASGNTVLEATLHGLYEVLERDSSGCESRIVDLTSVPAGPAADVLELMRSAGVRVGVNALSSRVGLACFEARIVSDSLPIVCGGFGCHLDREVALCRALTEAAQSRLTVVAGTRDDIGAGEYARTLRGMTTIAADFGIADCDTVASVAFSDIPSKSGGCLSEDLADLVDRVTDIIGSPPMVVEHTRPWLEVPVVHVVCAGARSISGNLPNNFSE